MRRSKSTKKKKLDKAKANKSASSPPGPTKVHVSKRARTSMQHLKVSLCCIYITIIRPQCATCNKMYSLWQSMQQTLRKKGLLEVTIIEESDLSDNLKVSVRTQCPNGNNHETHVYTPAPLRALENLRRWVFVHTFNLKTRPHATQNGKGEMEGPDAEVYTHSIETSTFN